MSKYDLTIEEQDAALDAEASKALWAKCADCGHVWAAAYYPLNLETFAKIVKKHSSCPKCNGRGLVAKQDNGALLEGDER